MSNKIHYGTVPAYTPFYRPRPDHPFEGSPADDYKCVHCGHPRALHSAKSDPYEKLTDEQNEPEPPTPEQP